MTNEDIFKFLDDKYPVASACDFDNPGFLVGDRQAETLGALVTLDCDFEAISEAKKRNCNLIISHHPIIFTPIKQVTAESVVYCLIKSDISVISMHTNLDIGENGVADCICKAAGFENVKRYTSGDGFELRKSVIAPVSPDSLAGRLKKAFGAPVRYVSGKKNIENILICPGSGGEYILEAISAGFDALVTGDVKHSQFVDAENAGVSLFDIGHFFGEDAVVEPLAAQIKEHFPDLPVSAFHSERIRWSL